MDTKRIFDLVISTIAIVILSPLFIVIAIAIKMFSPGPVFFHQIRTGLHGRPFRIFKFRSMKVHDPKGVSQITIDGDNRITTVGKILRKTKLDELPQLFNVFLGEMSIIGPRPEVPEYTEKYSPENRDLVLSIKPGLSDFASIKFRNESELLAMQANPLLYYEKKLLPAKLRYGRFYAKRAKVSLDILIIIWTVLALFGWTPRQFRRKRERKQ